LWAGLALGGFEEVEVTELVDQPALVTEVPVDGRQLALDAQPAQPRLLGDLAHGGLYRRLLALHVPLRQPPVLVGIADQEEDDLVRAEPPIDDPAGARLDTRAAGRRGTAPPAPSPSTPPSHGSRVQRSARRSSPRPCADCRRRPRGAARTGGRGPHVPGLAGPAPRRPRLSEAGRAGHRPARAPASRPAPHTPRHGRADAPSRPSRPRHGRRRPGPAHTSPRPGATA